MINGCERKVNAVRSLTKARTNLWPEMHLASSSKRLAEALKKARAASTKLAVSFHSTHFCPEIKYREIPR